MNVETWPESLRQLAEVIGPERALELAEAVGGLDNVYVPRKPTSTHVWSRYLTPEEWARVTELLGGVHMRVPRHFLDGLRKTEILTLAEQGHSTREIALRTKVGERYVRRVIEGMRFPKLPRVKGDPRQRALFDE